MGRRSRPAWADDFADGSGLDWGGGEGGSYTSDLVEHWDFWSAVLAEDMSGRGREILMLAKGRCRTRGVGGRCQEYKQHTLPSSTQQPSLNTKTRRPSFRSCQHVVHATGKQPITLCLVVFQISYDQSPLEC